MSGGGSSRRGARLLETEVCVVGGGPGGLACAVSLALDGCAAVVVNDGPLAGDGIEGAFRSKAGFEISRQHLYASLRPDVFGRLSAPTASAVFADTAGAAARLRATAAGRLERLGVRLVRGRGRLLDAHTVAVGEARIRARHIVLATGSRPRVPAGAELVPGRVLTSDTVWELDDLPPRMLVLGGGVTGCELACIFAALGADTTLVDSQDRILAMEDPDLSAFVARAFSERGIRVIPSSRFERVEVAGGRVRATLAGGLAVESDAALLAVGRVPRTEGLGLEAAGIETNWAQAIPTRDSMQTNVPHVYAVGDVGVRTSPVDMALVHVAEAEGRRAARHILGEPFAANMDHVPYIVFTIPMMAGAGLNETVARERHGAVRVGKYPYGRNHRAHALFPPVGFVKLVVGPPGDDRILGVRAVGRDADTLVAPASIMIERQLPYQYLIRSIVAHPSLMECLQGAAHIVAGDALRYEEGEEYDYGPMQGGR